MRTYFRIASSLFCMCLITLCSIDVSADAAKGFSPKLLTSHQQFDEIRAYIDEEEGRFFESYIEQKAKLDSDLSMPMTVPVPKDGGGGYTHEVHKANYMLLLNAATVYQISRNKRYLGFVNEMLLEYAGLYPSLPLHPKRKVSSQIPGKLFWQSLNEAVWLFHVIQAYDLVREDLSEDDRDIIENNLLRPVAHFLSEGQPSTFNKIHNHGTWATAAVGMAGYVLGEDEWVSKALYGLDQSGNAGFIKQLDKLFSPDGYYTEGPYYQRYALMPFVIFAKAVDANQPELGIFEYRDGIILKAIDTTIQLSYNGLFFPINDAIKSKGIDTIELVYAVTIAYSATDDSRLLDIAKKQDKIILTADGLSVAKAIDDKLAQPYQFKSNVYRDGANGSAGALVVMRSNHSGKPAIVFKPASQGLGHGHFDKLNWQFYDHGSEVITDYGAARFLNIESKFGGRYLPENKTYAKQTVAHNTVVVNELSHFGSDLKTANKHAPNLLFFEDSNAGVISSASIDTAYDGVDLERTIGLVRIPGFHQDFVIDIFSVVSDKPAVFDLPLHYSGQIVETNLEIKANSKLLKPLGKNNGYQHIWNLGEATPSDSIAQVTWLNDNGRFYTKNDVISANEKYIFAELGANDPNFNLTKDSSYIQRIANVETHRFVSLLEVHGEYNPNEEYTLQAQTSVKDMSYEKQGSLSKLKVEFGSSSVLIVVDHDQTTQGDKKFDHDGAKFMTSGRLSVFSL